MMKIKKNRKCESGLKVYVYYNLHKHLFSIKALEGPFKGKVVAHASSLTLDACEFKVNEKGRQRVLRERVKHVHAGVLGYFNGNDKCPEGNITMEVVYNPYIYDQFVHKQSKEPVKFAEKIWFDRRKVFLIS